MSLNHRPGLILNAFVMGVGHHQAAWRHPAAPSHAAELTIDHYVDLARLAERGKFHSYFLADTLFLNPGVATNAHSNFEPLLSLAAIARETEHIGLVGTVSTAFYPPYYVARLLNTLDQVSGGRAGWNIVTSTVDAEARNFGHDAITRHDDRYRDAEDYVEVVLRLLDGWSDDALVRNVATGDYVDLAQVSTEPVEQGRLRVAGALDQPPSPQRRPVLFQAGRSPEGIAFAGRYAEVVFSVLSSAEETALFRKQLGEAAVIAGRRESDVRLVPGIWPFLGSTEAEAKQLYQELDELVTARQAASFLSYFTGVDLFEYEFDEEIPPLDPGFQGQQGRFERLRALIDSGENTLRKLHRAFGATRGHQFVVGTPEQVADSITEWYDAGRVDGFSIQAPILPQGLDGFVEHVVPLLQERGTFRTDYPEGNLTLRQQLEG